MKPKICITFSSDGHFQEAMKACSKIINFEKYYITFISMDKKVKKDERSIAIFYIDEVANKYKGYLEYYNGEFKL